jgi:mitochondrial chaperone BCS1
MVRKRRTAFDDDETPTVPEEDEEKNLSKQLFAQIGLPVYVISTFFPQLAHKLAKYPRLVKLLSIPFALWIGSEFLSTQLINLWSKLMSTAMTCVRIDSSDGPLHSSFRRFLDNKQLMQSHREMSASSLQFLRHQVDNGQYHVRHLPSGTSVIYDALNKFQFFWHDGRLFVLTVERKFRQIQLSDLTVWTFGWSPEPIRKMLDSAYANATKEDGKVLTSVLVPSSGARHWTQRSSKPRRPLESVYLAEGQKQMLLDDMEEYLDNETVRWYEDRGIPHRRGYLFHGKPGTGKTTLALALAGQYKLNVYILSLLDADIDDNALLNLFASIGRGSLVLLEDVDVAGLDNRPKQESKAKLKSKGKLSSSKSGTGVTLSGLLNAIDGAGAPEGHILVMTSNKPDALDEALVRAGRVDVWVEFSNATRTQIRDIFTNMYNPTGAYKKRQKALSVNHNGDEASPENEEAKATQAILKQKSTEKHNEIRLLAEQFADKVPQGRFSPAELQDYLILHKNKPQAAIDGAGKWVTEKLGDKRDEEDHQDDSESEEDNIFTQNPSRHSTAASSAGDLPSQASEKAEAEKSSKKSGEKSRDEVVVNSVAKQEATELLQRLKELQSQVKPSSSSSRKAGITTGQIINKQDEPLANTPG